MSPTEFKKLLDKYFNGECTPEELRLIDKWYGTIDHGRADLPDDAIGQKMWSKVKPARKLHVSRWYYTAAAVLLVAASSVIWLVQSPSANNHDASVPVTVEQQLDNLVETNNNTKFAQTVALSDGSIVTLSPHSTLRYPKQFEHDKRLIELSGEAFFDVKRDPTRPFMVYSNEIITKVLGTSFLIKAFESSSEIIVSVKSGRVSVSKNPEMEKGNVKNVREPVILTPNQQLVYQREKEILTKEIVPQPIVVVDKTDYFRMHFDGKPVTVIFHALEERYGIDIRYDEDVLQSCILTTKMNEEGFYERIDVICKAINAEYSVQDGAVVISSKGCQ